MGNGKKLNTQLHFLSVCCVVKSFIIFPDLSNFPQSRFKMSLASFLSAALASPSKDTLSAADNTLVDVARRSIHGSTLAERLASASMSTYAISRVLRLTANTIALHVNRIILEVETNPLFVIQNPVQNLLEHMRTHAVNSSEFMDKIQRVFTTVSLVEFLSPMPTPQVETLMAELKTHLLNPLQMKIECSIMVSTTFRSALQFTMKTLGEIASATLNKWVHGVISEALQLDLGEVNHDSVRSDAAAFLFGITYEYNSNEAEFNRMSVTISHYLAQHLDRNSHVIPVWQTLWTPTAIQAAVCLEATSPARPWSTAMKYVASHADRSNIGNVLVLSELTYTLHADFGVVLGADDRPAAARAIIDLMRTHSLLHAVRITRDVQENEASPLYGYALYPFTVADQRVYDAWPSVCARVRKSLRDREAVEALLAQMRGAIASNAASEVEVPAGSCDTLMADDWETGQLAVALNGDRRPDYLVRVADYERMLLHGTAENPFDRQEVKTVDVVRIRVQPATVP